MIISDYLSEIFHDSIKAVAEKQIAISIEITPEYENIKIEPWKSFEYTYEEPNFYPSCGASMKEES